MARTTTSPALQPDADVEGHAMGALHLVAYCFTASCMRKAA